MPLEEQQAETRASARSHLLGPSSPSLTCRRLRVPASGGTNRVAAPRLVPCRCAPWQRRDELELVQRPLLSVCCLGYSQRSPHLLPSSGPPPKRSPRSWSGIGAKGKKPRHHVTDQKSVASPRQSRTSPTASPRTCKPRSPVFFSHKPPSSSLIATLKTQSPRARATLFLANKTSYKIPEPTSGPGSLCLGRPISLTFSSLDLSIQPAPHPPPPPPPSLLSSPSLHLHFLPSCSQRQHRQTILPPFSLSRHFSADVSTEDAALRSRRRALQARLALDR